MQLFQLVVFLLAGALLLSVGDSAPATSPQVSPFTIPGAGQAIPDSYVVVLRKGISPQDFEAHQSWAQNKHKTRLGRRNDTNINGIHQSFTLGKMCGYHGTFDEATLAEIRQSGDVDYIEEDKVVVAYEMIMQDNPPSWGLPRISERRGEERNTYTFDSSAGEGINVYVLDTGVNTAHVDFGGRASWGINIVDLRRQDDQGHGTHVAGTIAGTSYGVAKRANIIAVKILGRNGSGSTSKVLSGIVWTIAHSMSGGRSPLKSVANMSLGGSYSRAINHAVEAAAAQGLTFVVAAGNDGEDASGYSPASSPDAITVGATDPGDLRASYSNYGSVVDVFAPGTRIVSTWNTSPVAVHVLSGTSMACPHVAGLAAYLIAQEGLSGPSSVSARIRALSQHGVVENPGPGSPNAFAWNGAA